MNTTQSKKTSGGDKCFFDVFYITLNVNMPKFTLRVNPRTGTAAAVVRKPLTIKVRKPQLKQLVFPPQNPRKSYIRNVPFQQMPPWRKKILRSIPPQFSPEFAKKQIHYVAAIVCHGMSCDSAKHLLCQNLVTCENPLFKTEYDLVFTSKYGDTSEVHGNSHLVGKYLCEKMKTRKNGSGAEFMEILDSTIDRGAFTSADGTNIGLGGSLGKKTILTQKDIGTNVADLELFVDGTHARFINDNDNDNDSIFLFKIDPINNCVYVKDHNVLAVNPDKLIQRQAGLDYVAQTAQHLQSIIEPTGAPMDPITGWSDMTHQLKEFKDDPDPDKRVVRLSDILGKKGIFPEGTVVVTYVCRSTLIDDLCVETPKTQDYSSVPSTPRHFPTFGEAIPPLDPTTPTPLDATPRSSHASMDEPFTDYNDWIDEPTMSAGWWDGGAIKKRAKTKKMPKRRRN